MGQCSDRNKINTGGTNRTDPVKRDIAGGMASRIQLTDKVTRVDVMEGYAMMEWEVPFLFVGHKIWDIALRPNYGVEIILIKRSGASSNDLEKIEHIVPKADTVIQSGDKLLLFGKNQMLEKLKKA